MARALRRAGLTLTLPALVGLATLLYWLAGRHFTGLWIMPDEAVYAERALGLWRHGRLPLLHGEGAGYSVLYPALLGVPLSVGHIATGYDSAKLLQALAMSLSAVPVFAYGRRLMGNGYALLAAVMTVTSPLLLYSGFLMTEVLSYPLSAFALVAIARAVETASRRDQAVALLLVAAAILTRVQAIVLVAVFAAAILVEAALARNRSRLPRFWPVWSLLVLAALTSAAAPGLFGAYAGTLTGSYPIVDSVRLVYDHLAYAVLMVAVAPVAALVVMTAQAALGREERAGARALLAVASCTLVLVTIQVGLFSARYAPHLLGRDLASLPPVLFLVFALWLSRGSPRPRIVTSLAIVAVLAVVVGAPWNDLVRPEALPDTMGIALVHRAFLGAGPSTMLAIGVCVLLVVFRFVPRRLALVLPALVLAVLATTTVLAWHDVSAKVRFDQRALLGTPRDWVDRAVRAPVAYVFNGDLGSWNVVWQQRFWNRRIDRAVELAPFSVPGPLPKLRVDVPPSGRLPISERYVVANDRDTFVGAPVTHQDRGTDQFGLTLWRLDGPPSISTIENGIKPNGDILGSADLTAFDCRGGRLELTLLPKATSDVEVDLDGKPALRAHIAGLPYWNGTAYVPPGHTSNRCLFTIRGGLLLGSTRIVFARS